MLNLAVALASFLVLHLIPLIPGMRQLMVGWVGRRGYMIAHSVISTVTLVWVIVATLQAPTILLWPAAGWQAWVTVILTPPALVFVVAGLLSPNALSLSFRSDGAVGQSAIAGISRHPVFWGAFIWAASHIPPNGDLRALLFFGSMTALAAAGFPLSERRAKRRLGPQWDKLAATTSIVPFVAIAQGRARLKLDVPIVVALLLAAATTGWLLHGGHALVFGVDPLTATTY